MERIIFPLPYTSNSYNGVGIVPSCFSTMSALAAGAVHLAYPNSRIVIAGEHTFGPDRASTGELMKDILVAQGVEATKVRLLDNASSPLNNTALQIRALDSYLRELALTDFKVVPVAHDFHMQRVKRMIDAYGLLAEFAEIGNILDQKGLKSAYERELSALEHFESRESLARAMSWIDPRGYVTMAVTAVLGPHVHDASFDPVSEKVEVFNQTARKRIAEVAELELDLAG